jgi:hypothetical protein
MTRQDYLDASAASIRILQILQVLAHLFPSEDSSNHGALVKFRTENRAENEQVRNPKQRQKKAGLFPGGDCRNNWIWVLFHSWFVPQSHGIFKAQRNAIMIVSQMFPYHFFCQL